MSGAAGEMKEERCNERRDGAAHATVCVSHTRNAPAHGSKAC